MPLQSRKAPARAGGGQSKATGPQLRQGDLFEAADAAVPAPAPGNHAMVRIAVAGGAQAMSKAQKAFNRLIAKIESQRRQLAQWQAFVPQFAQRVTQDLLPLQQQLDEQRLAMLQLLDAAHDGRGVTKGERAKLAALICDMAQELLSRHDDPVVLALHDKHSPISHAQARQEGAEALKAMAEDMFGLDMDEDDAAQSPEAVLQAMARKMQAQQDEAAEAPPRPQSAKAQTRQAQEQAASQSVREVYRKLASALHPDREPDPAERARKTALMQRVNQAYDRQDLLQLLELQMQFEQIDASHLAGIDAKRLQHYVDVLKTQSQELAQELQAVTAPFAPGQPFGRAAAPTPASVLAGLQGEAAQLRLASEELAQDLQDFADPRALKAWLKTYRLARAPAEGFDEFAMLLDTFQMAATRGARRR